MRIIAGEFRGRILKFPKSKLVRPTTDKNKEAIFNYLQNYLSFDGIKMCDIYAGSGSLGLESLSRGAAEVHFVEKNFQVFKILKENVSIGGRVLTSANIEVLCDKEMIETLITKKIIKRGKDEQAETGSKKASSK